MLDDSKKDEIRAFVARVMMQFNGDIALVSQAIQDEYGKQLEHVRLALRCVERSQQKEEPRLPKPKGPVWVRFEKEEDESGRFTDIEPLPDKCGSGTRCFKVRSKHGYVTMFLKYLCGSQATQSEIDIARALREYRSYNILRHPNIVEVYDAAWVRTEEGEFPFVATEFLDGVNLMEWREKHQNAPTPQQSGEIIRIIASTLQSLLDVDKGKVREVFGPTAKAEVMYLDLKPNNVMVLYRMPLDLQVGKLMDSLFLESVSHAQRWEAAQAINKVLELDSPHAIREHDVKTRKPFGDKLIAAIQIHVAFKPNKFVEFLVAVQEQHVGLSANNPLKTFVIQHRKGEKIPAVDQNNLKLIDFGSGGPAEAATAHSSAKTDEHYKAPERFHSDGQRPTPTKAWDIYSLGAILCYLSTGKHLDSPERHTSASWHEYLSHIDLHDPDLTLICQKCLAYEPTDRFSSPGQLEETLSDWLNSRPIRHIGRTYTWLQVEKLLWKRGREKDNVEDFMQIIARAAVVVGFFAGINGIIHSFFVLAGFTPDNAHQISNTPVLLLCFVTLAMVAYTTRWRFHSVKIVEPLIAFIVSCFCLLHFAIPEKYCSFPNWQETSTAVLVAMILVGIINICFGTLSSEWKEARLFGWIVLLSTFVMHPMINSGFGPYAMPLVCSVVEGIACFIFARHMYAVSRRHLAQLSD